LKTTASNIQDFSDDLVYWSGLQVRKGENVNFKIAVRKNELNRRDLDIKLLFSKENSDEEQICYYRLR
jgi:hypothetical protein